MKRGVILFAHGSRDPLWRVPIEAVRDNVEALGLQARCAYLELSTPDLHTAVADLATLGEPRLRRVIVTVNVPEAELPARSRQQAWPFELQWIDNARPAGRPATPMPS